MKEPKKKKQNKNYNKGITLIALVITIIVLLILAAVSIATLTGKNGILTKASTAKTQTAQASAEEQVELAVLGSYGSNGNLDYETLRNNLNQIPGISGVPSTITAEDFPLTVTVDGYEIEITATGTVTVKGTSSGVEQAVPGEKVSGNNKTYTNNGTAIIPVGFAIVPGLDDVSEGLVISDVANDTNNEGNQFVWIPVPDIDDFHTIEGYCNGRLDSMLSDCSEPYANGYRTEVAEYNAMKSSVEENGGFYIGRFEAGKNSSGNVIVQKNATVYNYIGWSNSNDMTNETGGAVELSKNFASEKGYTSVTSTLCYGVQWDATLQFIDSNYINGTCDSTSFVVNSTGKGNYSRSLINTGSNDDYAVKNIYDMAGNVYEWTMEAYIYTIGNRVFRGSCYDEDGSNNPASRRSFYRPSTTYDIIGFRVALYL